MAQNTTGHTTNKGIDQILGIYLCASVKLDVRILHAIPTRMHVCKLKMLVSAKETDERELSEQGYAQAFGCFAFFAAVMPYVQQRICALVFCPIILS